jgi:hypothetical protein
MMARQHCISAFWISVLISLHGMALEKGGQGGSEYSFHNGCTTGTRPEFVAVQMHAMHLYHNSTPVLHMHMHMHIEKTMEVTTPSLTAILPVVQKFYLIHKF